MKLESITFSFIHPKYGVITASFGVKNYCRVYFNNKSFMFGKVQDFDEKTALYCINFVIEGYEQSLLTQIKNDK